MGQYGAVIGGVVGAVVGFFAGGNVYAGWMIGSALGGAYSASQQVIPGPKIGDVGQQTAQEGGPRPIVYARSHPLAGNIILDGGPRIVKRRERQGKGGPKVESESAYRTYAVGVCEGPITAFMQVWKNNQLVYDAEDPSMAQENAEFMRYARFFLGTYEQMPSPDLEAVKGVGNVPAHRGTAYMVLKDEDVTDQRGMWSQWTFRVSTAATSGAPEDFNFGASGSDVPTSLNAGPILGLTPSGDPFALYSYSVPNWDPVYVGDYLNLRFYNEDFTSYAPGTYTNLGGRPRSPLQGVEPIGVSGSYMVADNGWGFPFGVYISGVFASELVPNESAIDSWHYAESSYAPEYAGLCWIVGNALFLGVRATGGTRVDYNRIYKWPLFDNGGGRVVASAQTGEISEDTAGPRFWMHVSRSGKVRSINTLYEQRRYDDGLGFEGLEDFPDSLTSVVPSFFHGFGVDEEYDLAAYCYSREGSGHFLTVFRRSSGEQLASYQISAEGSNSIVTRVMFSNGYIYLQRRASFYYVSVSVKEGSIILGQIVQDISNRANVGEHVDVSALTQPVRGFTVTNQYPAHGALQALSQVFFFDPANVSGQIRFVNRGAPSVATVTETDMIDMGDDFNIEEVRRDTISVPRVLHLNYYDVAGGLNTDKQISERPEAARANGEQSLQTTVVLSADEAATVVAINHGAIAEMQKGELNFGLPDKFIRFTEADPIIVQWEGKSVRGVIAQVETDDGEQRYKVTRDRQSLYTTRVEGIPAAPVTRPPSSIAGATMLEFLDTPILRDADDRLGFYVAVAGTGPAWPGAFVELSLDGGATYEEGERVTSSSVIGRTTTPLGDHPQEYPDSVNTLSVQISTPGAVLDPTTLEGMLNRRNLAAIGSELVNFATTDEMTPGTWEVSYMLRGRKGTETQAHPVGTRFVLLDGAIFVPADLILLNRTLTFRATTFGRPVEEATVTSVTFTGQSQRERAPAYLTAYRSAGNAVISWQGVGRLGGGVNVAMGAYFSGYRLTLTDGAQTQVIETQDMSASVDISSMSGPVTISVQQRNSLTGLGPAIEVAI